jgi:hypothetical protein
MARPSASSLLNSGNSRYLYKMPIIQQDLVTTHGFQAAFNESSSIVEAVDPARLTG